MKMTRLKEHHKPLAAIITIWIGFFGLLLLVLHGVYHQAMPIQDWWSLSCLTLLISWWVIYDIVRNTTSIKIPHLKQFLEETSALRPGVEMDRLDNADVKNAAQTMTSKAYSEPAAIGLFMATIALFFVLISQWSGPIDTFQNGVRTAAYFVGGLSVMLLLISVEAFDTVTNLFKPKVEDFEKADLAIKRYFYKRASLCLYSYGYPAFMIFLVLSLSFISPFISGIAVAVFVWLGYPYWWRGWICEYCNQKFEIKEAVESFKVARLLGLIIAGFTLMLWFLTTSTQIFSSLI
jgi:hypothetical protein